MGAVGLATACALLRDGTSDEVPVCSATAIGLACVILSRGAEHARVFPWSLLGWTAPAAPTRRPGVRDLCSGCFGWAEEDLLLLVETGDSLLVFSLSKLSV